MIAALGSFLLAICGLPEALKAYETKQCSVGWGMLLTWLLGELLLIIFAFQTKQYILLVNYFSNVAFISIMIFYKIFSKKS